ncbi:hypothetical protein MTO96_030634 [Rhipicephalus appendiculatus]
MATIRTKKSRKEYSHHSKEFGVPKTTFYRRRRKNAQGLRESLDEAASETCADDTPSSSASQRSSDHVPREPSPALDEAGSSTCGDDAPCSSTNQCSSDHVPREPSPTLVTYTPWRLATAGRHRTTAKTRYWPQHLAN